MAAVDSRKDKASGGGGRGRRFSSRELEADEVDRLLREHSWGVLGTSTDDVPYAVPVIYGYDGENFYVIMVAGKKTAILEKNPEVSLNIVDVREPGMEWRSVIVAGRVEWVTDVKGWLHAIVTLRRQRGHSGRASLKEAKQLARAKVARIVPHEITGRAKAD